MSIKKDPKTGKWVLQYRYTDWQGNRKKTTKRGFDTKREAEEWLRTFLVKSQADLTMKFKDFMDIYFEDCSTRLRKTTITNKHYIVDDKLLPYFAEKPMNAIRAADIRKWQNTLIGQGYAETYLKSINNQLTAIFNFAVKYYDLGSNPCTKAGSMGKSRASEMKFWTVDEYHQFIDCMMDKRRSYTAFELLFWTGMRKGELLALTKGDIDLENNVITVSKSYTRLKKEDLITPPKTPKSNRKIGIPEFLAEDIADYFNSLYGLEDEDRLFQMGENYLNKELERGCKKSGVKQIRVHDMRHSHAAMLAYMKIMPLEVAQRLGHEDVETTLNIYEHLYPDSQARLAEQINEKYEEVMNK